MSTKKSYQKGPGLRDSLRKKEKNISARGGRISTGPANPTLDIITHQPLTQGSGTPSDVRPRTDKEFDKSILLLKDGAGNEASRSASPEGVTENASTLSEYGLNIKSSNDDVNKIEYCLCDARVWKHQGGSLDHVAGFSKVIIVLLYPYFAHNSQCNAMLYWKPLYA